MSTASTSTVTNTESSSGLVTTTTTTTTTSSAVTCASSSNAAAKLVTEASNGRTTRLFIGCYSQELPFVKGSGVGVTVVDVDMTTGAMTHLPGSSATESLVNPTYMTVDANGKLLYVTSENYDEPSKLMVYNVEESGRLTSCGSPVSTKGTGGCFTALDHNERHVLVANYMSGSVAVAKANADGSLNPELACFEQYDPSDKSSVDPGRQADCCHAHQVLMDPSGKFCYVPDLGADLVRQYSYDAANGTLTPLKVPGLKMPPGAGPRHMVFHPELPICYVVNELLSSVTTCRFDPESGVLTIINTLSTLPPGIKIGPDPESTCAAIRILPDGTSLYCSNRGQDTLSRFKIDSEGMLTAAERAKSGGATPRDFIILQSKLVVVANQDSCSVDTLFLDSHGRLSPTGHSLKTGTPAVICACQPH